MPRKLIACLLLAAIVCPVCARADSEVANSVDDSSAPILLFSAFGTAGVVHSSEARADFTSSIFKPTGAGNTHTWSADVDSILGAQVIADATAQLSATVQVISQQRYNNTYAPQVEWANIKYQVTPDISVLVGRIVLP